MRFIYLLIFLLPFTVVGQVLKPQKVNTHKTTAPKKVLSTDSSIIEVRSFDKNKLAELKQQPQFRYKEGNRAATLWHRFWAWVWDILKGLWPKPGAGFKSFFAACIQYLLIGLGLAALAFLILRVAGVDINGLFKRKAKDAGLAYNETLENIHEINFDADIDSAINNNNYRLAIRLLYLRSLKQLSDAGLIHWQIDKTNAAYINELTHAEQREAFTVLTRQFEYAWYGEFAINKQSFQNINTLFTNFKHTLA